MKLEINSQKEINNKKHNNFSNNNLSRIITPPSMKQARSYPSYTYYEPYDAKEKSSHEKKILSTATSNNVDN